jgi:hypothetical protein
MLFHSNVASRSGIALDIICGSARIALLGGGIADVQLVSLQNFASAANQSFDLAIGEAAMPLTLVEVRPLPPRPFPGMAREPFSLIFRSQSQLVLPQRSYKLRHPEMGDLDVFLVPVGKDVQGVLYQAVYN